MNQINTTISSAFRPADRVASIGVSEILRIGAVAAARKRAGRPTIILGAGEPDFDTPVHVKEAANRAIQSGDTKYTALDGTAELKAAVIEKFRRDNGLAFAPNEISCSAGAKQVLFNAFMATLNPGDEVIVPAPFWTSYADIVSVCGGTPIVVTCTEDDGFRLTGAAFERAITPRTRWLLLNSPSNPTGAAYERQHLAEFAEVLMRHPQIWAMSDDIYEHILYDGLEFHTLCGVEPALKSRTLIVNGVSKAYAMTGWRIGYGAGPADLIATMAAVQSQVTSCPSSISQAAAVAALTGPQDIVAERTRSFQHRRDLLVSALNAIEGITCLRPQGAFYTYSSCAGLIGKRAPNGDLIATDSDFCRYLLDAVDVAVVPGSCFGVGPYFRISYAAAEADLIEACARIDRACKALS